MRSLIVNHLPFWITYSCVIGVYLVLDVNCYKIMAPYCDYEVNATLVSSHSTWLSLSGCPRIKLQPGDLAFLYQLSKLTMVQMGLQEFPNVSEVGSTLTELELYFNNISHIHPTYLAALPNLKVLNLGNNPLLAHVPDIPQLSNLRGIYLAVTALHSIPRLTYAAQLWVMTISNKVDSVDGDVLRPLQKLQKLKMLSNPMAKVPDFRAVNGSIRELMLGGGLMSSAPATHMIGLRSLATLDVSGAPHLEVVPSLCHENVAGLSMRVGGSALRLCDCRNAWLKQAAEAGANIEAANATCGGLSWHNLTTQQLLQVCTDGSYDGRVRKSFWESVPVDRPCAFPLHSILYDTPLSLCVNTCFDKIPGCLSFNFRPQLEERTRGDCVFVAPTAASPMQAPESALADTEGWMYVGAV